MILKGNYIFTKPGQKCFEIASNFTNYIELGLQGITKYYLEAKIEDNEFKISGTLLNKNGDINCNLKDNNIESRKRSKQCFKKTTKNGYMLTDRFGNKLIEIVIVQNICYIKGIIYGESGEIIAQDISLDGQSAKTYDSGDGHFFTMKGPITIGKGNVFGEEYIGFYIER